MQQTPGATTMNVDSLYSACKDQRPSFLDESVGRFVNPLALSFVRIPATVWPTTLVGEESTGTLKTSDQRTVRMGDRDNYVTSFAESYAKELTAGAPSSDGYIVDGRRKKNDSEKSGGRGGGGGSIGSPVLNLLYKHVNTSTNGRLNFVSMRKLTLDQASITERDESLLASAFDLATFRVMDHVTTANNVNTFSSLAKKVRDTAVDMKQCEALLRKTIRVCNSAIDESAVLDFDKSLAVNEIMANGGIYFLLKEYVAFMSALQTRKWQNLVNSGVLELNIRDLEQNRARDGRRVNEHVIKETYNRLSEKLRSEQTSASHVTSQLCAMRKLINATRYNLNQMFSHLYGQWNMLSESTRRCMDMLRAYNIYPPNVVVDNFDRDVRVLDMFKTIEIARSANMFLTKYVEDKYDIVYDLFSPLNLRLITTTASPSLSNERDFAYGDSTGKKIGLREQTMRALSFFTEKLRQTREHYSEGLTELACADIRHIVFAYQKLVKSRLEYLFFQIPHDLNSLQLKPVSEREATQRRRKRRLKPVATSAIDRRVERWFDDMETEYCNDVRSLRFHIDESTGFITPTGDALVDRYDEGYVDHRDDNDYDNGDEDATMEREKQNVYGCRGLGGTVLMLRELQDIYDYEFFVRTVDQQLDKLVTKRQQETENLVNVDSEFAKWDDRNIAEELEQNIRSTFNEPLSTWDRLVQRAELLDQQANSNVNTETGHVPRYRNSERINCWLYKNFDDLNFTVLHAKCTLLDSRQETSDLMATVSRFAYLLSWVMEMRAFAPVTGPRAIDTSPDTSDISSDEEEAYEGTNGDGGDRYNTFNQTIYADGRRTRPAEGSVDGAIPATTIGDELLPSAPTAAEIAEDNLANDASGELDATDRRATTNQTQDITSEIANITNVGGVGNTTVTSSSELRGKRKLDYDDEDIDANNVAVKRPRTTTTTTTTTTATVAQVAASRKREREDEYEDDRAKRARVATRYDVSPRDVSARTAETATTPRGTIPRGFHDPTNDPLRGTRQPNISRRNVNQGLQRLRRIAEMSPSEMGVAMLNDTFEKETRRRKVLRSGVRKNLGKLRSLLGLPEFKFVRTD